MRAIDLVGFISRGLIRRGELKHMVEHEDLTGFNSNPTICEIDGHDYDQSVSRLIGADPQLTAYQLYERMSIEDVRMAGRCPARCL